MTTYFTEKHEWVRVEGDTATVGITAYAARQLGGVVFVELPEVGAKVGQMEEFGVVESSKTASEVFSPVSGTVLEVNAPLTEATERIDADPEGDAWLVRLKMDDAGELGGLMDKAAYDAFCAGH